MPTRKKLLAAAGFFLLLALVTLLSLFYSFSISTILLILLEVVLCIPLFLYLSKGHKDPMEMMLIATVYMGLGFLGRYIMLKIYPESDPFLSQSSIPKGLLIQTLAVAFMLFGYYAVFKMKKKENKAEDREAPFSVMGVGFVVYIVVLISRLYLFKINNVVAFDFNNYDAPQAFTIYANMFSMLGPACWGSFYYLYSKKNNKDYKSRSIILILLAIEVVWALLSGSKTPLVELGIMWLLGRQTGSKLKLTKKQIGAFVLLVCTAFILINGIRNAYKNIYGNDEASISNQVSVINSLSFSQESITQGLLVMASRNDVLDSICRIVDLTPDRVAYHEGNQYLEMFFIPVIPRRFWPDKPSYDDGLYTAWTYRGMRDNYYVHLATGMAGGFYWNYGILGTLIGMFITGMVYAGVYCWFQRRGKYTDYGYLLYSVLMLKMINMEGTMYTMYITLVPVTMMILVITFGLYVLRRSMSRGYVLVKA